MVLWLTWYTNHSILASCPLKILLVWLAQGIIGFYVALGISCVATDTERAPAWLSYCSAAVPQLLLTSTCRQVDDLIATGGTMAAGLELMKKVEATVVECTVVIEAPDLKGRAKLGDTPLYALIEKKGA